MRVRNVIQSRMSSTRLPGKALLPIAQIPVVVLCAKRAANSGIETLIATSTNVEDDELCQVVQEAGFEVVRGELDDVLSRFIKATSGLDDTDIVIRLTADNVFPDGDLLSQLANSVSSQVPYARIGGPEIPYGLSAEAFRVSALRSYPPEEREKPSNREHVTPWIRDHFGDHLLDVPVSTSWAPSLRCTIDTADDYENVARVFDSVENPVGISWESLCDLLNPGADSESSIVLGTVQLGIPYGKNAQRQMPTYDESQHILATAANLQFAGIDTARAYGLSEERIGDAAAAGIATELKITTKIRPLDSLLETASAQEGQLAVRESFTSSLTHLQATKVAALITHRSSDWHKPGVKQTLQEFLAEGKVQQIGVSLSTPTELFEALKDPLCTYVQLPFNILDHRWNSEELQDLIAQRSDATIVSRSVLLQGLLVETSGGRWPKNVQTSHEDVIQCLDSMVTDFKRESRLDLCLAYVNGVNWIDAMVLGCDSADQAIDLSRLSKKVSLTASEIREVYDRLPKIDEKLLDPSLWK